MLVLHPTCPEPDAGIVNFYQTKVRSGGMALGGMCN